MLPPGNPCDMFARSFSSCGTQKISVLPLQFVIGRNFQVLIILYVQFVSWVCDRCGQPWCFLLGFQHVQRRQCSFIAVELARLSSLNHRTTAGWSGLLLLWHIFQNGQLNGCASVVRTVDRMFHREIYLYVPSVRMCPRWWLMLQLPRIGCHIRDVSAVCC